MTPTPRRCIFEVERNIEEITEKELMDYVEKAITTKIKNYPDISKSIYFFSHFDNIVVSINGYFYDNSVNLIKFLSCEKFSLSQVDIGNFNHKECSFEIDVENIDDYVNFCKIGSDNVEAIILKPDDVDTPEEQKVEEILEKDETPEENKVEDKVNFDLEDYGPNKEFLTVDEVKLIIKHSFQHNDYSCYDQIISAKYEKTFSGKTIMIPIDDKEDIKTSKFHCKFNEVNKLINQFAKRVVARVKIGDGVYYVKNRDDNFFKTLKLDTTLTVKILATKKGKLYVPEAAYRKIHLYRSIIHNNINTFENIECKAFYPDQNILKCPDSLNIFPGFKYHSPTRFINEEKIEVWKDFILTDICSGQKDQSDYIHSCFTKIIGFGQKASMCFGMITQKGGCGKSLLMEILHNLLGNLFVKGGIHANLYGQFNSNAKGKLVIVIEEIPKNKSDVQDMFNDLKSYADEEYMNFTGKRKDTIIERTENIGTYFILSNNHSVFNIRKNEDSRKFFFPDINQSRADDKEYYRRVSKYKRDDEMMISITNFYRNMADNFVEHPKPFTKTMGKVLQRGEGQDWYSQFISDYFTNEDSETGFVLDQNCFLYRDEPKLPYFIPSSVITEIIKADYSNGNIANSTILTNVKLELQNKFVKFVPSKRSIDKKRVPGYMFEKVIFLDTTEGNKAFDEDD